MKGVNCIMEDSKLARINELYKKSQNEGLTAEEKKEQADLRYILIKSGWYRYRIIKEK